MNCVHCSDPNPEGWFYCRSCGKRSSEPLYNTQFVIRESPWAGAIRKDMIDFNMVSMDDSIRSMKKEFDEANTKKWDDRVKKARIQGD